jgi:2-hydroxycyclohexanecarboxyl-CoA dehydrogenase
MDLGLKDARVIVTGGASHIGQAIVWAFAAEGAALALIDIDSERAGAEAACAAAMTALGGIDVLVTNAGSNRPDFFLNLDPLDWPHTLDLNLTSVMACVRAVLPSMAAARSGAIVSIASTAAFGEPRQSVYAAAKAGVVAFIKSIAREYGSRGVRANLVSPGLTLPANPDALGAHSLWNDKDAVMNDAQTDYVVRNTPLRQLAQAEDIANAVVFLASGVAARHVTGEMITVSGGFGR